ncbi:hypothetical protein IMCC3317_45280 [Kordia antarctica]|uniref:Uncharacterized protein n=1 Tax=Kordia antarctica TaxID=1218801 RepID=A0A7L4ZRJ0_9FLAO|nr:hypothetical protein [Kordia antarctica]QHI39127.1 hypothetical protein IMCC3317_45280 [Kordia antarctica]
MKTLYTVNISKFSTIEELPNAWTDRNYIELLEEMDYGDSSTIDPAELREMCMMAITDNEPNEAAKILLDYIFKDELNDGQKENLSHEMIDEKLWEQYAELSMHEAFFNVGQLLYQSYNGKFPHPEAVRFQASIEAKNSHDLEIFEDQDEATILRLLTKGMPENTLINRLFKDEIEGEEFSEAKNIIWQLKKMGAEGNSLTFEIISSLYWFHDLKYIESFEGTTHPDEDEPVED